MFKGGRGSRCPSAASSGLRCHLYGDWKFLQIMYRKLSAGVDFFSLFSKTSWSSQICNVRVSACCQVHQGLHLLKLERRVVSGKFLAVGHSETFSQNKDNFSWCQRSLRSTVCPRAASTAGLLWTSGSATGCFGVMSYLSPDDPQSRAVSQPHTRTPGLFSRPWRQMASQLSESCFCFGKNMSNLTFFCELLGFDALLFPMKKCFVRKFLLNFTAQKQLEYKSFSLFVSLLFSI